MSKKSTKDILQAPRGMRDFTGNEYIRRRNFYNQAQLIAERHGFSGIETPIMEHTEIFHKGVGEGTDIVDKEMYSLETSGGDKLTLRPEGTAAVMRSYIEHGMGSLPQPLFFHYSGPFFRHEKPQKGRYRQLYQFGLEIMGSKNPIYDALIIQTGYEIVKKTDKNIIVEINTLGNKDERATYIKKLESFYKKNITALSIADQRRIETNPLRILDSKDPKTIVLNKKAPLLIDSLGSESREYFNTVLDLLKKLSIPYTVLSSLVRGLDYYEHTVFEYAAIDSKGNKTHALGGGGRYDGLAETMGHNKAVPSVGLGIGVDRTLEASPKNYFLNKNKRKKIFIISLDNKGFIKSFNVANELQEKNISVYLNTSDAKIQKQFEKAEKLDMDYALIIGEKEIEKNIIIIKNLKTRTQKEVSIENIIKEINNL